MKKVLKKIYSQNKNFRPENNPVSWPKAVAYVQAKDKRLADRSVFMPLFEAIKDEMRAEGVHESVVQERAKKKAKEVIKAQRAIASAPAQQSLTEQENVLA